MSALFVVCMSQSRCLFFHRFHSFFYSIFTYNTLHPFQKSSIEISTGDNNNEMKLNPNALTQLVAVRWFNKLFRLKSFRWRVVSGQKIFRVAVFLGEKKLPNESEREKRASKARRVLVEFVLLDVKKGFVLFCLVIHLYTVNALFAPTLNVPKKKAIQNYF